MLSEAMTGNLIIVSAPSGAGKTTLVTEVLRRDGHLRPSISYTSREPRHGEVDGRDYHFVTGEQFRELIESGELLEWAQVHGNYYGTGRRPIAEMRAAGFDVVLTIDIQGEEQVRRFFPDAISVFILPPSFETLVGRIGTRGEIDPEDLRVRLRNAEIEVSRYRRFDYLIVNDTLDEAVSDLAAIIRSSRCRRDRQSPMAEEILQTFAGAHPVPHINNDMIAGLTAMTDNKGDL